MAQNILWLQIFFDTNIPFDTSIFLDTNISLDFKYYLEQIYLPIQVSFLLQIFFNTNISFDTGRFFSVAYLFGAKHQECLCFFPLKGKIPTTNTFFHTSIFWVQIYFLRQMHLPASVYSLIPNIIWYKHTFRYKYILQLEKSRSRQRPRIYCLVQICPGGYFST